MKNIILQLITFVLSIVMIFSQDNHGIDTHLMDTSIKPQDDFYNYTNGKWMENTEIPSDRSRWGSFDELREFTDSVALGILKKSLKQDYKYGDDLQKVADLYNSITNWDLRNKIGKDPLIKYLSIIDNIKNLTELQEYFIESTPYGGNNLYGFYVYTHMKDSKKNTLYLTGPSLGLGRDYYQKEDEKSKETLAKYGEFLTKLVSVVGIKLETSVAEVIEFETKLAQSMKKVEEIRNAQLRYNPVDVEDFSNFSKDIDLQKYLEHFRIEIKTVIIPEINYYHSIDQFINTKNLPVIKDYLKITAANNSAGLLDKELDELNFEFYGKALRGQKEQRDIEKRALSTINRSIGEVLGKLYVAEVFPPEAKENCKMMVDYLKKSFKMHIQNLEWMSDETKVKALEKLSKFSVKVGYPDKWRDYSKLEILPTEKGGSYFQNSLEIGKWRFYDNLSDLDKPVDKTRWGMTPQTVNAYYNPSNNEIVFPAAILQPPFYNYKADMAVNFGGIGAVIGHEISHGFDDSGAQYDGDGNLNNWWTEEDSKKFTEAGNALAEQYSKYQPIPDVYVNGKFTLGENIADLGGVSVAYDALQLYLQDNKRPKNIDGFTPEQRFFLSWATIWRSKYTDEAIANQVKTDPHSPGYFRAIGPLVNQESFYKAFKVKKGDEMYKEDRIIIW